MSENRPPMQDRSAVGIGEVNVRKRIIEVIAVPYEPETAVVPFRGEMWKESFAHGAFDGIEDRRQQWMVNREHTVGRTVGRVLHWSPERPEGLVAEVKVAHTPDGNEVLELADDEDGPMVAASIRFGAWTKNVLMDRASMSRRILKAFIDHLSFVEKPAYEGAQVLGVRDSGLVVMAADLPPLPTTPAVDEMAAFVAGVRSRYPAVK
jgi:phage head maturation protease